MREKSKQVVEWKRTGKKHKFSKRPRNVVLTFENSAQAEEFLNRREEVVAQDGAIKMREFRSEKEMQAHRLKMWRKRPEWTKMEKISALRASIKGPNQPTLIY